MKEPLFDFKNRVVVVTGGTSGIGEGVSQIFHDLNAKVVLLGRDRKKGGALARNLDKNFKEVLYFSCDVANEKELKRVKTEIVRRWKKIDVLVTCAAAPAAVGKTESLSFQKWRSVLQTDLDGVFLSCKVFGGEMLKKRYGRIVNLTSFHTVATYPERAAYNAAKSGVQGLTHALAVEWGSYGVTVNAVAPGPIETPRTNWFLSQDPLMKKGMIGRTPTARIGQVKDVACLVAFLASENASHINGEQIVIDGGWSHSSWWGKHERKY